MKIPFEEMYLALLNKDVTYDGLFITAVKTTGIFCRPTCTARKPQRENVEFFSDVEQAQQHGYRPCKICKPLENRGQTPDYIQQILQLLVGDPTKKIRDDDLIELNIEPNKVRRWFKAHHQMTFHAYQRMFRINNAWRQIAQGANALNSAFDQGYGSLSGFNSAYKKVTGVTPVKTKQTLMINATRITTPLGPMVACVSDRGICLLEFSDQKTLEPELAKLKKLLKAEIVYANHPLIESLARQLGEYFNGQRKTFDLLIDLLGTDFQRTTWQALMQVPYGETKSYSQQAQAMGKPAAVRAVARANGMNRISIIIPCHRIIGANGTLTGYAGGLARKKWLLDLEQRGLEKD